LPSSWPEHGNSIRQSTQQQQCRQKCQSPIKAGGRRKGHCRHATIARVIRIPIRLAVVASSRVYVRFFSVSLRWLHMRLRIRGRAESFLDAGPVLNEFGTGCWKEPSSGAATTSAPGRAYCCVECCNSTSTISSKVCNAFFVVRRPRAWSFYGIHTIPNWFWFIVWRRVFFIHGLCFCEGGGRGIGVGDWNKLVRNRHETAAAAATALPTKGTSRRRRR
jgi:hypothetical protein